MDRRDLFKAVAVGSVSLFAGNQVLAKKESKKRPSAIRRLDEAVLNEFKDVQVINEEGRAFTVPIIWADDEKAQSVSELGKDGAITRVKAPLLNIFHTDFHFNSITNKILIDYFLNARTVYTEDMNQIIEQVILKFEYEYIGIVPIRKTKVGKLELHEIKEVFSCIANPRMVEYSFKLLLETDYLGRRNG